MGECSLAGALNDRPIPKRIAERNAQLNHVRAGIDGLKRDGARGVESGVTGGEINDQSRLLIENDSHRKVALTLPGS